MRTFILYPSTKKNMNMLIIIKVFIDLCLQHKKKQENYKENIIMSHIKSLEFKIENKEELR